MTGSRVAIYARYSSNRQSERSVDDQIKLCREHAEALSLDVVETYSDHAMSGASAHNRPGLQALLADAKGDRFEAVVAEALDRFSRDQEDTAAIFKRLSFAGVALRTVSEGEINELHVGLKGTMNALYLKDLADKTRRGLRARAAEGLAACGISYGYAKVHELGTDGEPVRGLRRVNETEAPIVRRIFAEYAAGKSPRAIVRDLNGEGVPSPRGGQWNASTINGNRARRNGILHNELYTGLVVWNRQSFRIDPETGKRVGRINPREDWIVVEVPDLRIVDAETWDRVQAIKARHADRPTHQRRRPRKLLSGLVKCGVCGGGCTILSRERFGCASAKERGTCDNRRTLAYGELERRVLEGIKTSLLAPDVIAEAMRGYHAELKSLRTRHERGRSAASAELAKVRRKIANIVDTIADGGAPRSLVATLTELEARELELADILAATAEPNVIELRPEAYRQRIEALHEALNANDPDRLQAVEIIRSLIDRIVVHPGEGRGEMEVYIHGRLAEILNLGADGPGTTMMVAGAGFEPATFRL